MVWNGGYKRFSRKNTPDVEIPTSEQSKRFHERMTAKAEERRKRVDAVKAKAAGRTAVDDAIRQMDEKWGRE